MSKKGFSSTIIILAVALLVLGGMGWYKYRTENLTPTPSRTSITSSTIGKSETLEQKLSLPYLVSCKKISSLSLPNALNPKMPHEVNFTQVKVIGNYAYILDQYNYGLHIINVSDPFTPQLIGGLKVNKQLQSADDSSANTWSSTGIYFSNNYAYLIDFDKFKIIDVSNKTQPREISTYSPEPCSCEINANWAPSGCCNNRIYNLSAFAINGRYAYATDRGAGYGGALPGMYIFDISNPYTPKMIGTFLKDYYINGIYALDNYIYLATANGLIIADVTNPSSPTVIGSVDFQGSRDIYVRNNYAYVTSFVLPRGADNTDGKATLYIIDITNPAHPKIVQSLTDSTNFGSHIVNVDSNYLYVGGFDNLKYRNGNIDVIDISKPSSPKIIQKYQVPLDQISDYAAGYDVKNGYVYSNSDNGLQIFECK